MCLGNISKDFTVDDIKKLDYLGMHLIFFFDCNTTVVSDTGDIHKHLTKKQNIKCSNLLKKLLLPYKDFGESLVYVPKVSGHKKSISLNNEPCLA